MTRIAVIAAVLGELEGRSPSTEVHQPVALHAGDRLAHRGTALAEPLGDARPHRGHALLLELVDRPEVHLGRVDEVAHTPQCALPVQGTASGTSVAPCPAPSVMWFRRDLRLRDNPALRAALRRAGGPAVRRRPRAVGPGRRRAPRLARPLPARPGRRAGRRPASSGTATPPEVVPAVAREVEAGAVHVAADFGALRPRARRRRRAGARRHGAARAARAARTPSPPGTLRTGGGHALPRVHPLLPGLGARGLARPPVAGAPLAPPGSRCPATASRRARTSAPTLPDGGRGGGAASVAALPRRAGSTTTPSTATGPTSTARPRCRRT